MLRAVAPVPLVEVLNVAGSTGVVWLCHVGGTGRGKPLRLQQFGIRTVLHVAGSSTRGIELDTGSHLVLSRGAALIVGVVLRLPEVRSVMLNSSALESPAKIVTTEFSSYPCHTSR